MQLAKFLVPFLVIALFYILSFTFFEVPILAYLIGLFLVAIAIVSHIGIYFKGKIRTHDPDVSFKFIINDAYPMMISSAIVMIMGWSDVFILGFYVLIGIYCVLCKACTAK